MWLEIIGGTGGCKRGLQSMENELITHGPHGRVKIGNSWKILPTSEVGDSGVLTLPALTFTKAGTYTVKLTLESGGSKYVTVKIKK